MTTDAGTDTRTETLKMNALNDRLAAAEARTEAAEQLIEGAKDDGANFVLEKLCKTLGLDVSEAVWDAATETWDGDVASVLIGILRDAHVLDPDTDETAMARIKALEAENKRLREAVQEAACLISSTSRELGELQGTARGVDAGLLLYWKAEAERLREALEFYANPEIYKLSQHGIAFDRPDKSFVARAALEGK